MPGHDIQPAHIRPTAANHCVFVYWGICTCSWMPRNTLLHAHPCDAPRPCPICIDGQIPECLYKSLGGQAVSVWILNKCQLCFCFRECHSTCLHPAYGHGFALILRGPKLWTLAWVPWSRLSTPSNLYSKITYARKAEVITASIPSNVKQVQPMNNTEQIYLVDL